MSSDEKSPPKPSEAGPGSALQPSPTPGAPNPITGVLGPFAGPQFPLFPQAPPPTALNIAVGNMPAGIAMMQSLGPDLQRQLLADSAAFSNK
jgi:hypothetical protein